MRCPNGHGPMTTGRSVWFCEDCSHKVPLQTENAVPDPSLPGPTTESALEPGQGHSAPSALTQGSTLRPGVSAGRRLGHDPPADVPRHCRP